MTCETQCQSYQTENCAVWRKDKAPFILSNPAICPHYKPNGKTPSPQLSKPKPQPTTTWKPRDRIKLFCMDCNNFRTAACPHPDRKILADPPQDFCPNFDDMYSEHKPQQPATPTEQTTPQIQPNPPPEPQIPPTNAICPKCHKRGSLQHREIPQSSGHRYWYCAHYNPNKASKLSWCYIGKTLPEVFP